MNNWNLEKFLKKIKICHHLVTPIPLQPCMTFCPLWNKKMIFFLKNHEGK